MASGLFSDVTKTTLPNGMTVLIKEDFSCPVVCCNFYVGVGSNTETDDVWGWSHGIEHMLFKGTKRRGVGDIAREVKRLGGELNAATGYESTHYYVCLPVEGFEQALDIHADALMNSRFDPDALDAERNVIIEELQMYQDVPEGFGFTWDILMSVAFTRHRYGRSIIGTEDTLRETPRDRIVDYFHRGYAPGNIIYTVAGAVDTQEAIAALTRTVGRIPERPVDLPRSEPEPAQDRFRHVAITGDVELGYFKIGFHVPAELHADSAPLGVLAHLLGVGRSSRLQQRVLEEKALVSQISVSAESGRDPGILLVDAVSKPENVEAAIAAVYEEIGRFSLEPVTDRELEKAVTNVIVDFVSALETVQGQTNVMGRFEHLGGYHLAEEHVERMRHVTAADVLRVAREYLTFDGSTVMTYLPGPKTGPDRSGEAAYAARLEARLADVTAAASDAAATAPKHASKKLSIPRVRANGRAERPGAVSETKLAGGSRFVFRENRKTPMVALAAYGRAGIRFEPRDRRGVGILTSRTLVKGTTRHSYAALAEEIDRHGITLYPFTDRDTIGFYLEALTDRLDQALDLFADILLDASFPEDEVERERRMLLIDIEQERDDTMAITMDALRAELYGDHPYGANPLGTPETVASITRDDLIAWHRRFFVAENLTFAAVGDVDGSALAATLSERLERLPRGEMAAAPPWVFTPPAEPVLTRIEKDKAQSVLVLAVPAPDVHSPTRFAHAVLNSVLSGMGARLFTVLRDERHLCYYTGSFYSSLDGAGSFGAYVGTSPDLVDGALEALRAELTRVVTDPPTSEEMERAINSLTGAHLIGLQRSGSQAAAFARADALGLGHANVLAYPDRIRAVTVEQVVAAAAETLDLKRSVTAILSPAPTATG